jgi:23S rRNA-/tRNA-specific pseudouridylate synthase
MVFPKQRQAAAWLSELFKNGEMKKVYLAIVTGAVPGDRWVAEGPIGKVGKSRYGVVEAGRTARTEFCRLASDGLHTLVEAVPVTGRTHQIRVHLSADGMPIVGDTTYGGIAAPRLMLHCKSLSFAGRRGEPIVLQAPPEAAFVTLLNQG